MQYFFILGREPALSLAELNAVLKNKKLIQATKRFAIFDLPAKINARNLIARLGGTVKIGNIARTNEISDLLPKTNKKIIFGINDYTGKINVLAMSKRIKKGLKQPARFVAAQKGEFISSVTAEKNKLLAENGAEINIFPGAIGKTLAIQPFEKFSQLDYGRPARDNRAGMLPPKLATIMINLSGTKLNAQILDPFCGSGTIIQQALWLGYKNIIGTDICQKAIADSAKNLQWFAKTLDCKTTAKNIKLFQYDARKLSQKFKTNSLDAIITEPFLGKPLTGRETKTFIEKQIRELTLFYAEILCELEKIIKKNSALIIIIPSFKLKNEILAIDINKIIPRQLKIENSWQYARPNQRLIRNLYKIIK